MGSALVETSHGETQGHPPAAVARPILTQSTDINCDRRCHIEPNAGLRTPEIRSSRGLLAKSQRSWPSKIELRKVADPCINAAKR
jgi:hypothetical protein